MFLLYIKNRDSKSLHQEFKKYIKSNDLNLKIVYFDGRNNIDNEFTQRFKKSFLMGNFSWLQQNVLKQSNIYVFENGQVVNILYEKSKNITISDIKKFIEGVDKKYD